jgi:hypothetical protein
MVRGAVLTVYDSEESDRLWDIEDMNDIIDCRALRQLEYLLIRAESPQGSEQFYLHLHTVIISDILRRHAVSAAEGI